MESEAVNHSESQGGYEHEFKDDIQERFICSICTKILRDPRLMLCCGYKYCHSCVNLWLQQKQFPSCPHCRSKSTDHVLEKGMKREIESFHVLCPNQSKGCNWTGELRTVQNHLKHGEGCQYREVVCLHCNSVCLVGTYESHTQSCQLHPVDCPLQCGQPGLIRQNLPSHIKQCKLLEVWCHRKYMGCSVRVQLGDMAYHLEHICQLRPAKCSHCLYKTTVKNLQRHTEVCKYVPTVCPNECQTVVLVHELKSHLEVCTFRLVSCEFARVGCDKKIKHQDVEHHMSEHQGDHLEMMTRAYDELSEKLERSAHKTEPKLGVQKNWFALILLFIMCTVTSALSQSLTLSVFCILSVSVLVYQVLSPEEPENVRKKRKKKEGRKRRKEEKKNEEEKKKKRKGKKKGKKKSFEPDLNQRPIDF